MKISHPSAKDIVIDIIDNPRFVTEAISLKNMTNISNRKKINERSAFGYDIHIKRNLYEPGKINLKK
jgi:hypothetical protein